MGKIRRQANNCSKIWDPFHAVIFTLLYFTIDILESSRKQRAQDGGKLVFTNTSVSWERQHQRVVVGHCNTFDYYFLFWITCMWMCLCVSEYMTAGSHAPQKRVLDCLEQKLRSRQPPNVGAGTELLRKSSISVWEFSISTFYYFKWLTPPPSSCFSGACYTNDRGSYVLSSIRLQLIPIQGSVLWGRPRFENIHLFCVCVSP